MVPGNPNQNPITAMEEPDSVSSTPYTSAPSSPGRSGSVSGGGYFFSAPASPIHFCLSSFPSATAAKNEADEEEVSTSNSTDEFEFDFSARSMISADEIFLNGQIRPMKLSSHLEEDERDGSSPPPFLAARGRDLRSMNRSLHRRTRSMSPVRNPTPFEWHDDDDDDDDDDDVVEEVEKDDSDGKRKECATLDDTDAKEAEKDSSTPPVSASSSRSSSSNSSSRRNSRRWIFFKDLLPLHRSKSEGSSSATVKEKFWHRHAISFSPSKDGRHIPNLHLPFFAKERSKRPKPPTPPSQTRDPPAAKKGVKPRHGVMRRRQREPSAHERHYTANRAQAEEMRKKTFLPYRQGLLLGCLGFTSKSYGAVSGFATSLNSVATS